MLGALCRASGKEPNPTYLHSYLHGNPAAQSLPSFSSSLSLSFSPPLILPPRSACAGRFTFPDPFLLHSPGRLKSNSRSHLNFDQSEGLICLAEETVTYWCRLSYTEMKKARRPVSENISVLTQTFTPCFIFSPLLSQKRQIYPETFYLLCWLIVPSCPSRWGRQAFVMITAPWNLSVCWPSH